MGCDYYIISWVRVTYADGDVKYLNETQEPRYIYYTDNDPDDDEITRYNKYREYKQNLLKSFTDSKVLYDVENGWTKTSYKHIETQIKNMTDVTCITRVTYAQERH